MNLGPGPRHGSHGEVSGEGSRDGAPLRVSVVVPALNEARNLPYVLGRIPAGVNEVILVDGGSRDNTVEVARQVLPSVTIVHQSRTGKGNALACGFAASTGDIIVMIDADGSMDPTEIPRFVEALLDGADLAKGSRFQSGGHSDDITRFRRLGNFFLNLTVNVLFGTRFTDLCYGYNAFWKTAIKVMDLPDVTLPKPPRGQRLWGDGFEVETMINVRVASHGLRIKEVPSVEAERLHGTSNLNAIRDGRRVLRTILTEYRRRRELARRTSTMPTQEFSVVIPMQRHPETPWLPAGQPLPAAPVPVEGEW